MQKLGMFKQHGREKEENPTSTTTWFSGAHGQAELGPGLASPLSLLCDLGPEPLSSLSMFSVPNRRWGQGWSRQHGHGLGVGVGAPRAGRTAHISWLGGQ